jgi:predicted dehydrogenase
MHLRVGVVGAGSIGKNHIRILSKLDGVQLVGICDINKPNVELKTELLVTDNLLDLIDMKLDYAVIAVPTSHHLDVAQLLAINGVHCLIEKPLAHNFESAKVIRDFFVDRGLKGAVGHIERFNEAVKQAKDQLDVLGEIIQISTRREGSYSGRISDVGVVKDDIDMVQWISGNPYEYVFAETDSKFDIKYEDSALTLGRLRGGIKVSHIVNRVSPRKIRSVSILGDRGAFEIDTLNSDLKFYMNWNNTSDRENINYPRDYTEGDVIKYPLQKIEPLRSEHENFRNFIQGKKAEVVSKQF